MSITSKLIGLALQQVTNVDLASGIDEVESWFSDHSQTLPKALARAYKHAWAALGLALAGESAFERVKGAFASGDSKGIREQVRCFLQANQASFNGTWIEARGECLQELNALRKSGRLSIEILSIKADLRQAADVRRYDDSESIIKAAEEAVEQIAEGLEIDYPNLARLLRAATPGNPPLLVAAFTFFFYREVENDKKLADHLIRNGLTWLSESQTRAFEEIDKAFDEIGEQFDVVFQGIGEVISQIGTIRDTTEDTRTAVLDLQAELQRLSEQGRASDAEARSLLTDVLLRLDRAGMQKGEVRPQHSFSIWNEGERRLVKALLERFRQLPTEQQSKVPALLNGLGKLQVGIGDLEGARENFSKAVRLLGGNAPRAEAEVHYNAFRTTLEQKQWDDALAEIQKAADLDRERFEPFPQRYKPSRILGAGGAGTVFLCYDRADSKDVVVKALHGTEMELEIDEVFREAKVLRQLEHPAIIRIWHWDFADWHRQARPYLVMEHFPGCTLEEYVQQHGTLKPKDLLPLAKQIIEGMLAAHSRQVLHRDLKPTNVLVRKDGDEWRIKLIDFGLAARQGIEGNLSRFSTGNTVLSHSIIGTLRYAPPEQLSRLAGIDIGPYSDVYGFGKLCCYALFKTTDVKIHQWNSIPVELAIFLSKCVEDDIYKRFPTFDSAMSSITERSIIESLSIDKSLTHHKRRHMILGMQLWEVTCPVCYHSQDTEEDQFFCKKCATPLKLPKDSYGRTMASDDIDGIETDDAVIEDYYGDYESVLCPHCGKKQNVTPYHAHCCSSCKKVFAIDITSASKFLTYSNWQHIGLMDAGNNS